MIFNKALRDVNYQDIVDLIERGEEESYLLDYKREINYNNKDDKKEICKDVSSFANSRGGILIYGIEEEKNGDAAPRPKNDIPPFGVEILDTERIENIISNGIYPRVNIEIKLVKNDNRKNFILIIGIAASSNAPHMVVSKGDFRYYKRGNYESEVMNEADVRELYRRNEDMLEKLNDLIKERRVLIFELNPNLRNTVTYSFIISPMVLHNELISLNQDIVEQVHETYTKDIVFCPNLNPSLYGYYADNTYNYSPPESDNMELEKFVEVCRNGLIQSSGIIVTDSNHLDPNNIKTILINLIKLSNKLYQDNRYYGLVLFDLNIKGIKNYDLLLDSGVSRYKYGRDEIKIIEENTGNTEVIVDKLLNRIFNAFGVEKHNLNLKEIQ